MYRRGGPAGSLFLDGGTGILEDQRDVDPRAVVPGAPPPGDARSPSARVRGAPRPAWRPPSGRSWPMPGVRGEAHPAACSPTCAASSLVAASTRPMISVARLASSCPRVQPDPTTDPLQELYAERCFQARQVVTDRRVRVVVLFAASVTIRASLPLSGSSRWSRLSLDQRYYGTVEIGIGRHELFAPSDSYGSHS